MIRAAAAWIARLALLVGLSGCGDDGTTPRQPTTARASSTAAVPIEGDPPAEPEPAELFTRSRPLMGTVFSISVADADPALAEPAVRDALAEIERLEHVLSEWRPESEISRINAAAGRAPVEVGPDTLAVLKAGLEISAWSDGAFDLSWAALRGIYSFPPHDSRRPSAEELRRKLPLVSYEDVVLDETRRTVFLKRAGMALGTGGIAKGYALDRAARILLDRGIRNFMIFGGGQVQVEGRRGDRKWRVGIQHPRRPDQYFAFIEVDHGSISTSGDYEHFFMDGDDRVHHIIDPRTGRSAQGSVSVTVVAESGIYADALSTACFVLGPTRSLDRLGSAPAHPEAVILDPALELFTTPGTRERLHMTGEI